MNHLEIVKQIKGLKENIILIYAFNTTGKTRLSVTYKDESKTKDDKHTGVYYNAFSEDLFQWDNDIYNNEENIKLTIVKSSLNQFHSFLNEDDIRAKLKPYKPNFNFEFNTYKDDPSKGIESISFFIKGDEEKEKIKISRGEERIFIWCFFLALFEVEGWADNQNQHFFIDDPVSSLDDHNIFMTALSLYDLIEKHYKDRKLIITTHHIGFFSILVNWFMNGEKRDLYKKYIKSYILNKDKDNNLSLDNPKNSIFLYHLHLLQILYKAKESNTLGAYHFVLLRQVLENISSFLGTGRFSYVLEQLEFDKDEKIADIINILSHKTIYTYESEINVPDNKTLLEDILNRLQEKYHFILHTGS